MTEYDEKMCHVRFINTSIEIKKVEMYPYFMSFPYKMMSFPQKLKNRVSPTGFNTHFCGRRNAKKTARKERKKTKILLSPKMYGNQSEMVFRDLFRDLQGP